jgi:hypothetical protein
MDVGVGTFFSNVVMFFIILTTVIKLLAPFLLIANLAVASDKKLMQGQPSSRLGWTWWRSPQ